MNNLQAVKALWNSLAAREKRLVAGALGLVVLALLWWVALAPALATLRGAEAQHQTLDAQLQRMARLQSQARALQSQPRQSHDDASRLLDVAVRQTLGTSGRLSIAGDRVTLTLTGTSPVALAQWLTQARVDAHALPSEARLSRNANGLWEGTVVLALPPR
jgi:general secretion pathway protein M